MPPKDKQKDANSALSARQYAQYQAIEGIVEEFGPFAQDISADGAHYLNAADNLFSVQGIQCANCAFYAGAGRCGAVNGAIDPAGLCKLWIVPEQLLVAPLVYQISGVQPPVIKRAGAGDAGETLRGQIDLEQAAEGKVVVHKQLAVKVLDKRKDGGRILISTPSYDRDRDRVMPLGGQLDDYLKNPVVQWGHNYYDPWATTGRTNQLEVTAEGIIADFELRPAANDQDPQNIILLLWNGEWVRTASIGFIPLSAKPNDNGGLDFNTWSLLEWSIVPIPSNQDALRLAARSYPKALAAYVEKAGARHSAEDMAILQRMHDDAVTLGATCSTTEEQPKSAQPKVFMPAFDESMARAWVRRLEVESEAGPQTVLAAFSGYEVRIPENAVLLDCDPETGELVTVPHPDAGQTVKRKQVAFMPPIDTGWDEYNYLYGAQGDDRQAVEGYDDWDVRDLSEVLAWIPVTEGKAAASTSSYLPIQHITRRGMRLATITLRKAARAAQRSPATGDDPSDDEAAQLLARLDSLKNLATRQPASRTTTTE